MSEPTTEAGRVLVNEPEWSDKEHRRQQALAIEAEAREQVIEHPALYLTVVPESGDPVIDRDVVTDAIWRALVAHDRAKRTMRDLRAATGGGPTVKRGTGRVALARYLSEVVITALREEAGG